MPFPTFILLFASSLRFANDEMSFDEKGVIEQIVGRRTLRRVDFETSFDDVDGERHFLSLFERACRFDFGMKGSERSRALRESFHRFVRRPKRALA